MPEPSPQRIRGRRPDPVVHRPAVRALGGLREWEGPGAGALLLCSRRLTACPPVRWPICRRVTPSWSWQPKVARTVSPQRLPCLAAWSPYWRRLPTPMPPRFLRLGALAARPAGKRPHPDAVPAQSISRSSGDPMSFRPVQTALLHFLVLLLILATGAHLYAQAPSGGLSGVVTDPSGGVIAKATVRLVTSSGRSLDTTTNRDGFYEFKGLAPSTYTLKAAAKGFALFTKEGVQILDGQTQQLNIGLTIQIEEQEVEVTDSSTRVDVDPSSNAGMVVLKGKDLEALSDDPDELQSELQALAGPSAGPNGGQIYIDGITGGQLPPKSAIREIRVNQNPFSAQYDKLGYGRIEILTKPGSDKFHGQFMFNDSNAIFNSKNPYVPTKPDYNSDIFDGNFGGPLSKKASFFIDAQRRNTNEFSAINATVLDSSFNPVQLQESIPNPRTRTNFSPRLDYQINANNALTVRYQLTHETSQGGGLGQFSLPSQAYNLNETEQTVQISDSQIVSPKIVNETRFQFLRASNHQLPFSAAPAVQVQGAFTS